MADRGSLEGECAAASRVAQFGEKATVPRAIERHTVDDDVCALGTFDDPFRTQQAGGVHTIAEDDGQRSPGVAAGDPQAGIRGIDQGGVADPFAAGQRPAHRIDLPCQWTAERERVAERQQRRLIVIAQPAQCRPLPRAASPPSSSLARRRRAFTRTARLRLDAGWPPSVPDREPKTPVAAAKPKAARPTRGTHRLATTSIATAPRPCQSRARRRCRPSQAQGDRLDEKLHQHVPRFAPIAIRRPISLVPFSHRRTVFRRCRCRRR